MAWLLAVAVLAAVVRAEVVVSTRPQKLYGAVSPKMRIQGTGMTGPASDIQLTFVPSLAAAAYNLTKIKNQDGSDTGSGLSLSLKKGNKWAVPNADASPITMFLTSVKIGGVEQLAGGNAVQVCTVIPTPTVLKNDRILYSSGTQNFLINGTNFATKGTVLSFDPPIQEGTDYLLDVKSPTSMQLRLQWHKRWRSEPGPLLLRRIDTGAGALRLDAAFGGVTVAEVQADLGQHGVTVESHPDRFIYQSEATLFVRGEGFFPGNTTLRWANGLRGKGVNYTTSTSASPNQLTLLRNTETDTAGKQTHKWRNNPKNLPGPLVLLAVNAGAGWVPVGPTEMKKGRTVATVFEDVSIVEHPATQLYQTHSHELWITGTGFTRPSSSPAYSTTVTFDRELVVGLDVSVTVYNRTHVYVSLLDGRSWRPEPGPLKVLTVNTGAGEVVFPGGGKVVATVVADAAEHASGLTVQRSALGLYQTGAVHKLVINGNGFSTNPTMVMSPPISAQVDYSIMSATTDKIVLSLKKNKHWRGAAGALLLVSMDVGNGPVEFAEGNGIQIANVLADPTVVSSPRLIYSTHTKRLVVQGTGFALEGTELTLRPTPRSAYEIESIDSTEMTLLLNEGQRWAPSTDEENPNGIFVTKVDTGAGEVLMAGAGTQVARVKPDSSTQQCDDSCEWALDGICDDGSGGDRNWWDDDYGGYNYGEYDDDFYDYGYGYGYYDDDDFMAPVCDVGEDCTDCGGPDAGNEAPAGGGDGDGGSNVCTNTCQWSWDGYCDDSRTSGLCEQGTDCHDCGTVEASNFTIWDDDGWWDDDDNYWDDDFETGYDNGGDNSIPRAKMVKVEDFDDHSGSGGTFIWLLQSTVVVVGAIICGGGGLLAYRYHQAGGSFSNLPAYMPVATAEDEQSLMRGGGGGGGRGGSIGMTEITPDVIRT